MIKLENVWKIYHLGKTRLEVLKGVNLEIKKKDFVILLGPSGSGKSTLLNIISALDIPTKGKVFLGGKDVSHFSEDSLAQVRGKKIGFVFQQFNLLPHFTALENVILPTIFQSMPEEERKEKAQNILQSLGLKERILHRPSELSGGERQRVAIARALINDPDIIVADEPTGNIDSKTGEKIMKILKDLNEKGKTIVVVTHDIDLSEYGNRVVRIKDGEIIS